MTYHLCVVGMHVTLENYYSFIQILFSKGFLLLIGVLVFYSKEYSPIGQSEGQAKDVSLCDDTKTVSMNS